MSELGRAFDRVASSYARGRPDYPADAVATLAAELAIGPGRRVLDLAAGTGKLTAQLRALGADVVAVEPLAAMRAELSALLPEVVCLDGSAEAIPLEDARVDAVTVAQAFHWFDAPVALAEVARVLRPGGGLGLIWNERDESVGWIHEMSRITRWDTDAPYPVGTDWREVIDPIGGFTPVQVLRTHHSQEMDAARLVEAVRSRSYIARMEDAERDPILAAVEQLVSGFPTPFTLDYVTSAYWCHRA